MKKLFFLAVAVVAMLSACSDDKGDVVDNPKEESKDVTDDQAPTFTATIENLTTRAAIDGESVCWENGEEVTLVFNSKENRSFAAFSAAKYTVTPSADELWPGWPNKATLKIKKGETIKLGSDALCLAVSPASMYNSGNNVITFPHTQDYKGDGKLPFAPMVFDNYKSYDDPSLDPCPSNFAFTNVAAQLKITVPGSLIESVKKINVTSNLFMSGVMECEGAADDLTKLVINQTREGNPLGANRLTLDCYNYELSNVQIPADGSKTFYISIPQANYDYLRIEVTDGFDTKIMYMAETNIVRGALYSVTMENTIMGHDFVEIGGKKWATMNLGATTVAGSSATCFGDYYAWSETAPRYTGITINTPIKTSGDVTFTGWVNEHKKAYSSDDMPAYVSATLDAEHDVATQAWGNMWRTPTKEDFRALYEACGGTGDYTAENLPAGTASTTAKGIYWCKNYDGVAGMLFCDGSNKLFFPAAYCIIAEEFFTASGFNGNYWSSTHHPERADRAYYMYFNSKSLNPADVASPATGYSIRPLSDG